MVEARNLASRGSTGREEIIKAVRERHHRLSGNRKNVSKSGYTLYAGDDAGGGQKNLAAAETENADVGNARTRRYRHQ